MRDHITFLLNGTRTVVSGIDPTTTVLRWLRETQRLIGTKEGCAEGDCGACTVLVDGRSINACITLLPWLHGKDVLTVEGLAALSGAPHPAQQALVDCHGSQCGFCTPGFVMSLVALHRDHIAQGTRPSRHAIDEALGGNLCRCTGYGPIIDAASRMFDISSEDRTTISTTVDRATAELRGPNARAVLPATLDALADLAAAYPQATIVSGATDVGLWVTKQARALPSLIFTSAVADAAFTSVMPRDGGLWFGAGVTHSAAMEAPGVHPALRELWRRFAGRQVRNMGTVGGNIANGSPIGDLAPAFIALGATLHLRHGKTERRVPLEDFFIAYGRQDRRPGEIVVGIFVPQPNSAHDFTVHKVSKRFDDDISAVCGAFNIRVEHDCIAQARIAYGGMSAIPKRAKAVETALVGQPWTRAAIDAALPAYDMDFQPLSDVRASTTYRMHVAKNLLVRTFVERTLGADKTRLVGPSATVGA